MRTPTEIGYCTNQRSSARGRILDTGALVLDLYSVVFFSQGAPETAHVDTPRMQGIRQCCPVKATDSLLAPCCNVGSVDPGVGLQVQLLHDICTSRSTLYFRF